MADYKIPSLTTDIFIFDDDFNFILIKRLNDPYKDCWALPGGFVEYGESVESAAVREAKEETSIDVELIDLVNVYSKPDRTREAILLLSPILQKVILPIEEQIVMRRI